MLCFIFFWQVIFLNYRRGLVKVSMGQIKFKLRWRWLNFWRWRTGRAKTNMSDLTHHFFLFSFFSFLFFNHKISFAVCFTNRILLIPITLIIYLFMYNTSYTLPTLFWFSLSLPPSRTCTINWNNPYNMRIRTLNHLQRQRITSNLFVVVAMGAVVTVALPTLFPCPAFNNNDKAARLEAQRKIRSKQVVVNPRAPSSSPPTIATIQQHQQHDSGSI